MLLYGGILRSVRLIATSMGEDCIEIMASSTATPVVFSIVTTPRASTPAVICLGNSMRAASSPLAELGAPDAKRTCTVFPSFPLFRYDPAGYG